MSLDLRLKDPLGERRVASHELPLILGGEGAAIAVPGVDAGVPCASIGIDERGLFAEPAGAAGVVSLNGRLLEERSPLEHGDVLAVGEARIHCDLGPDGARLRVEHLAGNVTVAPLVSEEERAAALEGEAGPLAIHRTAFRPFAGGQRARTRTPVYLRMAISAGVVAVGAFLWFLTTATAVHVIADPGHAEIDFAGAWPEISFGAHHLIRPGSYVLVGSNVGYETTRLPVRVRGEPNQQFKVTLRKQPGLVSVDTNGLAATLLVDGQPLGAVPGEHRIAAGPHTVVIRAPRHLEFSTRVEVEGRGEKQMLKATLLPAYSPVTIESLPAGARVSVDGREIGVTPLTTELDAGSFTMRLAAEGYRNWESSIQVLANTPQRIGPVELGLPDGHLTVRSVPAQADVAIGGRYRGRTPLEVELAPGVEHEIVINRAGYEPARRRVPVRAAERIAIQVTLKPVLGEVTVRGEPPDAVLYVAGEARGPANQTLSLPATETSVEVRRTGFETFATSVTPQPGFPRIVEYRLKTPEQVREARFPAVVRAAPTGTELRLMPTGKFEMGSPRREPGRRANESQRPVTLQRPFYMGVKEVTNGEFRQFRPDHLSGVVRDRSLDQDTHPVVNVTWRDAALFCNWLSQQEGLPPAYGAKGEDELAAVTPATTGYRLPTEAEWEWVARYQKGSATRRYPWGSALPIAPRSGNYADATALELLAASLEQYDDGFETTAPVGSFAPNELGVYDLGGNVAEWTNDYYTVYVDLSSAGPAIDPSGPATGQSRVLRGSSWRTPSITELRLAARSRSDGKSDSIGFRIARYAE